jgi:chloride channel protein, CIC family
MIKFRQTRRIFNAILESVISLYVRTKKYLILLIEYFRTSETVFLLLFANIIGVGSGFGAILFRWMIRTFESLFFKDGKQILSFIGSYYVVIIPAIGGIIVGLLVYFFASETKGHGVPEVMLAVTKSGSKIRPRVAAIKALVSSVCIGSGGSVGREGPIVQISSAFGSSVGQLFRLSEDKTRILVACGAAGGIAATFNAPIAGIFFALEVILREYGVRYFSSVVLSAVMATVISRSFLGSTPAFITPAYTMVNNWEILNYFILGFLAAFVGWFFIKVLYKSEDIFNSFNIPDYIKPAIGGLVLGVIGFYFPQIFGVGYQTVDQTLNGNLAPLLIFGLIGLKILATSLTLGSGGSGGVFAPSLFIGAMVGSSFGSLLNNIFPAMNVSPGAYALVGMGAVFAGAAQAPITSIMILFEMTGDYKIILPLMITCVISTLVVKKISRDSIYTLKLRRRGINILSSKINDPMETIKVSDAMFRKVITVPENQSVIQASLLLESIAHKGCPVLDENGQLSGIITRYDIDEAIKNGKENDPVKEIMISDVITCKPEESLKTALERMAEKNIGRIPVVETSDHKHLVGLITRKSIISLYNPEQKKMNNDQ